MANSWHTYPSIYNLGHSAVKDLFSVPVNIEEKVGGSQFSFCVEEDGEVKVRSKGAVMIPDAPERMFASAVSTVKSLRSRAILAGRIAANSWPSQSTTPSPTTGFQISTSSSSTSIPATNPIFPTQRRRTRPGGSVGINILDYSNRIGYS